jgi:transcriptional regulator with XRE-family HTH domain
MTERSLSRTDPRRAEFAARLRAARLAKGLTQEQVGRILGVDRSYVNRLESGDRIESWPAWLRMVAILGYDLSLVAPELGHGKTSADLNTDHTPQHVDATRPKRSR